MNRRSFIQSIKSALSGTALISPAHAKPQFRNLLLLETSLAGFQYYQGQNIFQHLTAESSLSLQREPKNQFDFSAVEVYWQQQKLGYVPMESNIVIAQLLDRGEALNARIQRLSWSGNPWNRVKLNVYWMEQKAG